MEQDILKANMLSIAVAGLLLLLTGVFLYLFRNQIADHTRFLMPIPPLAVAAYIFVFNMYGHYGGNLPALTWNTAKELLISTAISAGAYAIFTLLLIIIVHFVKR